MNHHLGLILANGSDRGKVDIDATYIEMDDDVFESVNLTADLAVAGANGLDTGSEANDTWYSVWAIAHADGDVSGTALAGLLSLSATAPTMPSGYTLKVRVGWVRNNGSGDLYRFVNAAGDDWFWWNESTHAGDFRILTAGAATSMTDVSAAAVAPSTCREINIMALAIHATGLNTRVSIRNNALGNTGSASNQYGGLRSDNAGTDTTGVLGLFNVGVDSSQVLEYVNSDAAIDTYIDVHAYRDIR